MASGFGLDPDELRELDKTLKSASDELGMTDFESKASLEGFLTTQQVSQYENVEETVDESVRKLTEFVDEKYPKAVAAMQDFITRLHVTITTTAEGVAEAGKDYKITDEQIADWLEKHPN